MFFSPQDLEDSFTDADASEIDLDALHAPDEDGCEVDDDNYGDASKEAMLMDESFLPEEQSPTC